MVGIKIETGTVSRRRGAGVTMQPLVKIVNLRKVFGQREVLRGVSLEVHNGEVLCILGPSGGGKSTLLRCINHLEKIDGGVVWVDGEIIGYRLKGDVLKELPDREIRRQQREIGMVFQHFNLFPHFTVLQNIIEGPVNVRRRKKSEAIDEAMELLRVVGLEDRAKAYPSQLSGGQRQRVAIARALAMKPKLMLFDEPTSALDSELVGEVLDVMRTLAKSGTTMIVVTHEISFAREVADRVAIMVDGQIREIGQASDVLNSPTDERVRGFLARVLRTTDSAPDVTSVHKEERFS